MDVWDGANSPNMQNVLHHLQSWSWPLEIAYTYVPKLLKRQKQWIRGRSMEVNAKWDAKHF